MPEVDYQNIGNVVICDSCNEDYTNSDEQGGMQFSSHAICPKCEERWRANATKYNEEHLIKECPEGMSFKDFVVNVLREGNPGEIIITTW